MSEWRMLTLVGADRPGIVAAVTQALYDNGFSLGEASMMRLGGNFTIMMMISGKGDAEGLLAPLAQEMDLRLHLFEAGGRLHSHLAPNVQVRVHGADRAGIVAQVAGALAEKGFNILELESDVAGTEQRPVYIMHIEGFCDCPIEELERAISNLGELSVDVSPIETLIG
ncbi:MAG: ACT domain-containing protein [Gammaproteobacteria bacterium]|nr:ACT domain-containing protein [Gammaproteobacteria bacterium]MBU1653532.1 ACT domain-containing protein [Gammaproteobacteria bacterium]MBU1961654.1 ACT domain-containing protein [Gammaproteobacteria bacterium]